jgi:hypothetical protein
VSHDRPAQLQPTYNFRIRSFRGLPSRMYECRAHHRGALLFLPHGARSENVIVIGLYEDYIRDNVDSWLRWSKKACLPVENIDDLILVTGCTLATSWAAVAFDDTMSMDSDATKISLRVNRSDGGGVQYHWFDVRGNVKFHSSDFVPVRFPGYVSSP